MVMQCEIQACAATGVFPFNTNSSSNQVLPIFTKYELGWGVKRTINRVSRWEAGKLNYEGSRKSWQVSIDAPLAHGNLILDFIRSHHGAGTPFYWYDFASNGFQWDSAGGTTIGGRVLANFGDDEFQTTIVKGHRVKMDFSIVEVS